MLNKKKNREENTSKFPSSHLIRTRPVFYYTYILILLFVEGAARPTRGSLLVHYVG